MGYFSIYNIIKDIIKTIFDRKFWKFTIIIFILFTIFFILGEKGVSASSSFTYEVNNSSETLDLSALQNYKYYFICTYNSSDNLYYFQLINSLNGFTYYPSGRPWYNFYFTGANGNKRYDNAGSFSSLSDIQNIINNSTPRYTSDAYISYRTDYATGNNAINLELAQYSCNFDIINEFTNEVAFADTINVFSYPSFDNVSEIENGYPDGVFISRGDYSYNDMLYFHLLKITNTVQDGNNIIYYYSPKIFVLDKNSKYYRTWEGSSNDENSYYYIPRASLSLDTNSSYLYLLSNSSQSFTNSYGILEADTDSGIYAVVQSDTTGVITSADTTNDKIQNIDDTLNDNIVSSDTENNIEDNLSFDNQNAGLNNLNGGFFSRLTSMLSNLLGYNLAEDTSVSIPLPNTNKSIVLHSKDIYDNVTGALRLIINAFWVYIFSFYMWKFINKIYIAVSTGNILDGFSSGGEAITNDML